MSKISACVLTYNEAENIADLLANLEFCDEIVILDHFSTDGTADIAKTHPKVKCVQESFKGFKTQKNRALALAKHDWVLCIDADERLDDDAKTHILEKLINPQHIYAYRIARKCMYLGKWIRFGGWYPDYQVRFFHKRHAKWYGGETHEFVQTRDTAVGTITGNLLHYSFRSMTHQVEKNNFYSSRLARQAYLDDRSPWFGMLVRPLATFLRMYVLQRGFLDGFAGWVLAVNSAYSTFLKYAKLYEIKIKT
jgi:glycosyltransferase involved in cell wall biosynthesis